METSPSILTVLSSSIFSSTFHLNIKHPISERHHATSLSLEKNRQESFQLELFDMEVFIANLGEQNAQWPVCLAEGVLTLETSAKLLDYWRRNDRAGWLGWATKNERMVNGQMATSAVASRWFNLISIFYETTSDLWLHRDGDYLFWTTSVAGHVSDVEINDPTGKQRPYRLLKRPTQPWTNKARDGRSLLWRAIHPKAHHFLQTEATYQKIANDRRYKDYALSILNGPVLEELHTQEEWRSTLGAKTEVRISSKLEATIFNAVFQIGKTVLRADGRLVTTQTKHKDLLVSEEKMRQFLYKLYQDQSGICALSGIRMLLQNDDGPRDLMLSVDRIDSDGHYEPKNVQLVCRFANFWKSDGENERFKELIEMIRFSDELV